jgi:hypothetical protein
MTNRRKITPIFIALLAAISAPQVHAKENSRFKFELSPESVSDQAIPAVEKFLSDAEALLPPQMKNVLNRKVTVRFTHLDSTAEFVTPACNGEEQSAETTLNGNVAQVRGRVDQGRRLSEANASIVLLNSAMIAEIVKGSGQSKSYACGHRSLYRLALATLVHEISHLYDFTSYMTPERGYQLQDCIAQELKNGTSPNCEMEFSQHPRLVSGTPTFRNMEHWDPYSNRNFLHARSQDPYEFTRPEESFAVNMEYFLMDPEYGCRRPVEYRYFRDHFSFDPYPVRKCKLNTQLEMSNELIGASGAKFDLDPSRVYQVHYLFASKGKQMMSRFGHAMFRIILCNPTRKEVGPACLNDIANHVVVSFRANQGDWSIDSWKGLTGKYPSQMFLYPFYPAIVNEYTLDEPRDLISLPLNLNEQDKARFIERVIETYWTYQGKYYFITNNCATEALHLLKGVVQNPDFQNLDVATPIGLYQELSRFHLIDTELVSDQKQAMKKGYYFPTTNYVFEQAFGKIRNAAGAGMPFSSLDDYMKKSDAEWRKQLYVSLRSLKSLNTGVNTAQKNLASYFFILESYLVRTTRLDFMAELAHLLDDPKNEMSAKLHRVMELQQKSSPLSSPMTGYGVPSEEDLEAASQIVSDPARTDEELRLYREVMDWAKSQMLEQSQNMDATAKNRDFFLKEIRQPNG